MWSNAAALGDRGHVCAFFNDREEEYRVLLPFVQAGLERGEKIVHTIDPKRRDEHLMQIAASGIDIGALLRKGQFELRTWSDTHLRDGYFDGERTLKLFEAVVNNARCQGFSLIRFVTEMEWALKNETQMIDLLEYEAKANELWERQEGPVNPVICTYDLTKFKGDVVVDVMRTHPMIIIGGILQENPFYIPPKKFLKELRERRESQVNAPANTAKFIGNESSK
ncbi:MAG: MEDS domain-containing protein [Verrucomicrobia bacterium]|nr:MEDS domain-containing protein [Verrucomicrobiota bacterium]